MVAVDWLVLVLAALIPAAFCLGAKVEEERRRSRLSGQVKPTKTIRPKY